MAERLAAVDPAVDELRRKARRRLVGAIVLALAAAVILPMLLEKEPKPLGEDVAVRIPPVDEGKFVNRLSPPAEAGKGAAENAPSTSPGAVPSIPAPAPAPVAEGAKPAAAPTEAPPSAPPSAAATLPQDAAPSEPRPSAPSPVASNGKAEPKPSAAVEHKSDPAPEAKTGAVAATPAKSRSVEGFVVQLAAFSDDKGANALASKLKRNGYPAYTESIQTSRGTLYRVRVGGYGSREAAADARNRLKGDGYAGIVAAAH